MRFGSKKILIAAISLIIVAGSTVQVFAEERATVLLGVRSQQEEQAQDQPSLAEQYLFRLVQKSKGPRIVNGGIWTAYGACLLVGGIELAGQEDNPVSQFFGAGAAAFGAATLAIGVSLFATRSRAQRTSKQIQTIADHAQREKACENALAKLAKRGRTGRLVWGGILSFVAISMSAQKLEDHQSEVLIFSALCGARALYFFLAKSPAEKINQAYLEKRPLKTSPTLVFGLAPRGGFRIGLSLEF